MPHPQSGGADGAATYFISLFYLFVPSLVAKGFNAAYELQTREQDKINLK